MRKFIGFFLCCFIPSKKLRGYVREVFYTERGETKNFGGKNNKIILVKNGYEKYVKKIPGCQIFFKGNNNTVKIYEPLKRLHLSVKMYGDSEITIMPSLYLDRRLKIRGMHCCKLYIDSDLSTNSECLIQFSDKTDVYIGKNCMFSDFVEIRTGDGHTITDKDTDTVLNHNKSIYIGESVWVGKYVMILKGSKILNNTVVGARSLVSGVFDKGNVVIAGVPAKIIKQNVNWNRNAPD